MFGSNSTPFGAPAPAFGSSAPAFGSPAAAPFGSAPSAPAFGTTGGSAPGFGSPAAAPFGSAPFGSAPSAPAFGTTGGFGSPAPAPAFSAPAPGGFGSSAFGGSTTTFGGGGGAFGGFGSTNTASPFGAPPSGGLFGSAPAPSAGLFGSSTTGFGASPAPAFGSSGFGSAAPAPSGGLFGSSTTGFAASPAPGFGSSGFGSAAPAPSGGLFGSPAAAPTGSIFGSPAPSAQPGVGGTKGTPFQVTSRQDGTSSISMQSISAMNAYENKSFEELRYEDYLQGNKGSANAAGTPTSGFGTFGAFGAPAPSAAFGAPAPAPFGAPAPGAFGAAPSSGFGAPSSGFGAPSSGFGAPAPAPSTFGSSFGKPASNSLFGAPAPAPTGGLFGSNPASSGGMFGAPAPAPSGGMFGAPAPAPGTGLFGSTGSTFGSTGFGSPAPAAGGFFGGAPAPAAPTGGGLFGSPSPAPAFGTSTGSSLFGSPAPAPAGLFGAKPPGTSFFSPAPAPTSSFFGAPSPAPGIGMFGAQPPAPAAPIIPPAGSILPQAASEVLTHQIQALENKRKEMEKLDVWRGKSPEASRVVPSSQPHYDGGMSSALVTNSHYSPYRPSPRSTAKIRPRGFGSALLSPATTSTSPLNHIGTNGRPMMSPDAYAASSVKRLVIKHDSLTPKPMMRLRLANSPATSEAQKHALPVPFENTSPSATPEASSKPESSPSQSPMQSTVASIPVFGRGGTAPAPFGTPDTFRPNINGVTGGKTIASLEKIAPPADPSLKFYQQVVGSPDGVQPAGPSTLSPAAQSTTNQRKRPSYLPKLTKPNYVVRPSLKELELMSEADLASLAGFSIRHDPYGVVEWEGAVDVRNADLDVSVVIGQNDVSVYTRDEEEGRKPAVGSKLNRPAVITFFNVFPKNGGAEADEETKNKFAKKIERSTIKMDAELISYNRDNGEWKIRVRHFSRYGLEDSDSDDEANNPVGRDSTPEKEQLIVEDVDLWQDDEDLGLDDAAVVSDVEMEKENDIDEIVMRNADASYVSIFDTVKTYAEQQQAVVDEEEMELEMQQLESEAFVDEGEATDYGVEPVRRLKISKEEYAAAARIHGSSGICSKIAKEAFAGERRPPANIDYGFRMGKSHAVAWSPDGSFFKITPGGSVLKRCRPLFTADNAVAEDYLETHLASCEKLPTSVDDRSPRFVLPNLTLDRTLALYASQGAEIGRQAFSLLSCFVDTDESIARNEPAISGLSESARNCQITARRREAVVRFFVGACSSSSKSDIKAAVAKGDGHAAVFSALTGGDIAGACDLAEKFGLENLAACISTFDVSGQHDIAQHVRQTNGSERRIYRLLSGDKVDDYHLDWVRRFLILLVYDDPQGGASDLSEVLKAYDQDVKAMLSPYPSPQYRGAGAGVQNILYKILRLNESPLTVSCVDVIDQRGASSFPHDSSLGFHLASVLSAARVCAPLSPWQEESLIDSYSAQLTSSGRWEWAVFLCLCSMNPDILESTEYKRNKAKDLVLQHFHEEVAEEKKNFLLNSLGIPQEWIFEALATRSARICDPFQYLNLLANFAPSQAALVVDQVILPNLLVASSEVTEKSLRLLESFDSELSPISLAIKNLFELAKDVDRLSHSPRKVVLDEVPNLLLICNEIGKAIAHQKENAKFNNGSALNFQPSFETPPVSSLLAEALAEVSFFRLQLKALERGIEITNETTKKRLVANLAFYAATSSDDFPKASMLRGLR